MSTGSDWLHILFMQACYLRNATSSAEVVSSTASVNGWSEITGGAALEIRTVIDAGGSMGTELRVTPKKLS